MLQIRVPYLSALLVVLLVLTAPLTALAQDPLTEQYTSLTETLTFSYPAGWTVEEDAGIVAVSNDATAFDSETLPEGALGVVIVDPAVLSMLIGEQGLSVDEMLTTLALSISIDATGESLTPESVTLGDRAAARLNISTETEDVLLLGIDHGDGNVVVVIALASPGALAELEPTVLAIAESVEYTAPSYTRLQNHTDWVRTVAFSPDGMLLASGADDSTVRLWDVATGTEVHVLVHPDWLYSVAFSPDSALLASGGGDDVVHLWDTATGDEVATLAGHTDDVNGVAFSPDGMLLASGADDSTIRLWALDGDWQDQATISGHEGSVISVAFSPDGTQIVSGSGDSTARVWDVASGAEVLTLEHPDWVRSVAFSPDGTQIATGNDDDIVRVWDAATGELIAELTGHEDYVRSVAFSPDGGLIASGSDDTSVILWAFNGTWEQHDILMGHTDWVRAVAFSPDGALLASGSDDTSVILWDVAE